MKLEGSCHCGAVKFTRRIAHALPVHALLLLDLPQDRRRRRLRDQHHGRGGLAEGAREATSSACFARAFATSPAIARHAVAGSAPFLRQVRQRAVGLGPALARVGLSVRLGDRHAAAEAARGSRDDAGLRPAVGRHSARARSYALPRISPTRASPTGTRSAVSQSSSGATRRGAGVRPGRVDAAADRSASRVSSSARRPRHRSTAAASGECQREARKPECPVIGRPGLASRHRPGIGDRAGRDDLAGRERRELRLRGEHPREMDERQRGAVEHVGADAAIDDRAPAPQRQRERRERRRDRRAIARRQP